MQYSRLYTVSRCKNKCSTHVFTQYLNVTNAVLTSFDAVLERLFTVTEDLFQVLWILLYIQTVPHHLLQGVWVVEVQDLSTPVIVFLHIVQRYTEYLQHDVRGLLVTLRGREKV